MQELFSFPLSGCDVMRKRRNGFSLSSVGQHNTSPFGSEMGQGRDDTVTDRQRRSVGCTHSGWSDANAHSRAIWAH